MHWKFLSNNTNLSRNQVMQCNIRSTKINKMFIDIASKFCCLLEAVPGSVMNELSCSNLFED